MKKIFAAMLAVCMIIAGLSLKGNISRIDPIYMQESGGCRRADTYLKAETVLSRLGAECMWTEKIDGMTVYYGYSDFINGYEVVHGKRVNVMIAEKPDVTAVGIPLLVGSY